MDTTQTATPRITTDLLERFSHAPGVAWPVDRAGNFDPTKASLDHVVAISTIFCDPGGTTHAPPPAKSIAEPHRVASDRVDQCLANRLLV